MWDLIVSIPDHCLFFYFLLLEVLDSDTSVVYIHSVRQKLSKPVFCIASFRLP